VFETISSLARERGLSIGALAAIVGISSGNMYDWRSGRSRPSVEALGKLADFFGVSVDYLLGRTSKRKPYRQ